MFWKAIVIIQSAAGEDGVILFDRPYLMISNIKLSKMIWPDGLTKFSSLVNCHSTKFSQLIMGIEYLEPKW